MARSPLTPTQPPTTPVGAAEEVFDLTDVIALLLPPSPDEAPRVVDTAPPTRVPPELAVGIENMDEAALWDDPEMVALWEEADAAPPPPEAPPPPAARPALNLLRQMRA